MVKLAFIQSKWNVWASWFGRFGSPLYFQIQYERYLQQQHHHHHSCWCCCFLVLDLFLFFVHSYESHTWKRNQRTLSTIFICYLTVHIQVYNIIIHETLANVIIVTATLTRDLYVHHTIYWRWIFTIQFGSHFTIYIWTVRQRERETLMLKSITHSISFCSVVYDYHRISLSLHSVHRQFRSQNLLTGQVLFCRYVNQHTSRFVFVFLFLLCNFYLPNRNSCFVFWYWMLWNFVALPS